MSLKVYNGIKFKSKDICEVVAQLYAIKKHAVKNSNEYARAHGELIFRTLHSKGMFKNIDDLFERELTSDDYLDIWNVLVESLDSRMRERGTINFNFVIAIIPWTDGNIYGISYHDDIPENYELLKDIADEYHYQNQTDRPESLTDDEWEERSVVWNNIFDKYVCPNDAGMIYEIVTSSDLDNDVPAQALATFKDKFIVGFESECKVREGFDKKRINQLIKELEQPGVFVYDGSWFSTPFVLVRCKNINARAKAEEVLDKYSDVLDYGFQERHVRIDNFKK